ncbi:2-methylaconitate cis-trans isomerase PrpF family protein [Streptomyces sp. NPDC056948]|uniref:2-methylaconitate cis-trans isomerase PrpF family protein n=1 Tax=Streptomyces sp. NPDC056948 TaxID=3345975 RepID=UPI0036406E8E
MSMWISATFMRGGTSKGVFFDESALPGPGPERDRIFTGTLGSPDPFGRQLDGMGGGISSLSKVVSVAASQRADADLEYTFGQVAVDEAVVDYSGNCGNLSSAVVPFALLAGIITIDTDGPARVVVHNTNTDKLIVVRLHVTDGLADTTGDFALPGVAGTGSPIELQYLNPGGSKTGTVLPTGKPVDVLDLGDRAIEASLVDAANPMVFVDAADLGLTGTETPQDLDADPAVMALLDRIRRVAAVAMGLCSTPEDAPLAVPKVAMVAAPTDTVLLDGTPVPSEDCDIITRTVSMELVHRAIPGTAALCASTAANIPGTVVERLSSGTGTELRVATPSGVVASGAEVTIDAGVPTVAGASLFRTARALMRGQVAIEL